jgi:hypothetical protein
MGWLAETREAQRTAAAMPAQKLKPMPAIGSPEYVAMREKIHRAYADRFQRRERQLAERAAQSRSS